MDAKRVWFLLNLVFLASYSLRILKLFVRLPIPLLPNAFNSILLICVYAISLCHIRRNISKILESQNFICIGLFITFPHWILLFPFFLLSIYHSNGYILSHRDEFSSWSFFRLSVIIKENSTQLGLAAFYSELLCLLMALLMAVLRVSSLKTLLMYYVSVRQQYMQNSVMRSIVGQACQRMHACIERLPGPVRQTYDTVAGYVKRLHKTGGEEPKKQA